MQHSKILSYSIMCGILCASVAFAAQAPLTPEVTRENMLVSPDSNAKAKVPTASTSEGSEQANTKSQQPDVVVVPAQAVEQPEAVNEAVKPNASYKPTLAAPEAMSSRGKAESTPAVASSTAASPPAPEAGLVIPITPPAPSLGNLTFLRGQLEETKLKVAIAEQGARLRQITMPSPPPTPVQVVPQIPLDMLLDSQKVKSGKSSTIASPTPVKHSKGVVSIQGVNGVLSATIATGKGSVTVKQGDSFGGGKIESITYNQVMVRSGKKTAPIPFVE